MHVCSYCRSQDWHKPVVKGVIYNKGELYSAVSVGRRQTEGQYWGEVVNGGAVLGGRW